MVRRDLSEPSIDEGLPRSRDRPVSGRAHRRSSFREVLGALGAIAGLSLLSSCVQPSPAGSGAHLSARVDAASKGAFVATMRAASREVEPLVRTPWVRAFVRAASELPPVEPRTIYRDESGAHYYSPEAARALDPDVRATLWARTVGEEGYYTPPSSGSPLDYARAFDLLGSFGVDRMTGKRMLDFGYGGVGHLRMLSTLGVDVVGVDVDRTLLPLYADVRESLANRAPGCGRVTMLEGRFPADEKVALQVGDGFDLVISKNVLKRGYVHPAAPVPSHQRIDLGVDDETFRQKLFDILVPGGLLMLYNVSPPQAGAYKPWADGRSPWDRGAWERTGFRVIALDEDDSGPLRTIAHAIGWDKEPGVVLERDVFAMYTLLQRPR